MHKLFERLDALLSGLVPILYLGGLALGTLAYFSGVRLEIDGLIVGGALALAVECHSYLAQRRTRAARALVMRTPDTDEQYDTRRKEYQTQLWIMIGLVAFSMFNSVAFVAATWTPTPGFLPAPLQIFLRGAVIPVGFLATGALSPLHTDAATELATASRDMLRRALKATTRQWRERIGKAQRTGLDLAPVAVALMEDAGDTDGARRIQMIAAGLDAAEQRKRLPSARNDAQHGATDATGNGPAPILPTPPTPPTQPPAPRVRVRETDPEGEAAAAFTLPAATRITGVRAALPRPAGSPRPAKGMASASRSELRTRRIKAGRAILQAMSEEERARLSFPQLARLIAMRTQAGCSEHAARDIRKIVEAEERATHMREA